MSFAPIVDASSDCPNSLFGGVVFANVNCAGSRT